jgi:SAM-dependent methyltransferase
VLAERGHQVVIVGVSAGMLQIAQRNAAQAGIADRVTIFQSDICDLFGLDDDRFDLALALGDPLSYCTDAAKGLTELHRVTRKGGMLFVEVENRFTAARSGGRRGSGWAELLEVLRTGQAIMPDAPDFRIRMFEPTDLHLLLQDVGWRPVRTMPGHLLWALLGDDVLQQAGDDPQQFAEMLAAERELRACRDLWGAGGDIQVLACK